MNRKYFVPSLLVSLLVLGLTVAGLSGVRPVSAQGSDLIITGVIDGPLSGGVPKAVELYVVNDIPDLSIYGLESASNGSAADSPEFTFSGSASAGSFIYLATESTGFTNFFGFAPTFTHGGATSINGDDAIVLYQNGTIVDVFGEVGTSGSGVPWYHQDGWAYRVDNTGPDGSTFVLSNWSFSGPNALDGETSNATAATPFPIGTYGGGSQPTPTPVPTSTPVAQGCGTAATLIHAIQGSGSSNLMDGSEVAVEGVVVADFQTTSALSGFFVQEEDADADGNAATSEGIFVYESSSSPILDVSVGDVVRVTGTVDENFGVTSLDFPSIELCSSGNPLPSPASVQLPIPGFNATDPSAATAQIDAYFEPFEGMLVEFAQVLSAAEYFELSRFGQVVLASERLRQYTDQSVPTAAGYQQHLADIAAKSIILDDDNNIQNAALADDGTADDDPVFYPEPGGFSTTNFFRGGDTITNLTGVLDYAFGEWHVRPVAEQYDYQFTSANPRTAAPDPVGGSLKVASFNVLNYFTTIDTTSSNNSGPCGPSGTMDCRGADSEAERVRQLDKIVAALNAMDADIVGLIELENTPAANPAGDGVDPVLESIVDALNALNADTYAFIDTGAIGTDAIRVAFIYKTSTVAPTGNFAVLDSSVDPTFVDTRNRPALAQTFTEAATNGRVTVVVNHLKSKGSGCGSGDDDTTTGQGNCNGTRTAAATALANWLATDPTGSGDADVLIIGDLNAYRNEDPIVALENAGYTDLIDQFNGASAYGYLFDGQLGYLDHALANSSLLPQIAGVTEWHINADEVNLLDYNDMTLDAGEASFEEKPEPNPLYESNAYRSSDHDPVIVGLNLSGVVEANDLLGLSQVTQTYNGAPQPNAPAGTFTIAATFQSDGSAPPLDNLFFQVATLTNGNLLLNADGGPGGAGAILSVPAASLGGDGVLSPDESFSVEFVIGLQSFDSFDFFVDGYGQINGVGAASIVPLISQQFSQLTIEDAGNDMSVFLPLITQPGE